MGEARRAASALGSREWGDLQQVVEGFEAAWDAGKRPDIDAHLPAPGPVRRAALVELVNVELEYRLKAGEAARVEEYLRRYPELSRDREAAVELIVAEHRLRGRSGQGTDPEECVRRFPEYRDEILARLQTATASPAATAAPASRSPAATPSGLAPPTRLPEDGAAPTAPVSPPPLPNYRILGVLGSGGMGIVYRAEQVGLNRVVALKMILRDRDAPPEELARFQREAEAVARLKHPHIVQIYEIGSLSGVPFFSLEYADGGTLARRLAGGPLPPDEAAAVVETVARAMAYAHGQGVIHRDLKPGNVLLTAAGEPKVADFGLAKNLNEAGQTLSGAILGTPSYMAPEQAEGRLKDVGPATDVWALGAILYECLTGRPPFKGAGVPQTLEQVRALEPVPPSRLRRSVPRALEVICLKCLRKQPARRYPSALELAEDLARVRAGEPVHAQAEGLLGKAWRKGRRHLLSVAIAA